MSDSSVVSAGRTVTIALHGRCTLADVAGLWRALRSAGEDLGEGDGLRVDLSAVERADGAAVAVIEHARRELQRRGAVLVIASPPPGYDRLLGIYADSGDTGSDGAEDVAKGLLSTVGRSAADLARRIRSWLAFVGRLTQSLSGIVRHPRGVDWRAIPSLMEQAGADAVPIVVVVDFLIGVVTAYEALVQLRRFGATLYVADLVGASVVRELGPLITAVLVIGRTGAAFAAELGTMAVSEEVDALRTMGIDPIPYLVVPRLIAMAAVVPLLTLVGDCVGLLGGLLLTALLVGITPPEFMAEARTIVFASDVFWGLMKSFVFALAIGSIVCQQGLSASGGASGVGRRTTSAVVASLTAIICVDALFAPLFHGHYR